MDNSTEIQSKTSQESFLWSAYAGSVAAARHFIDQGGNINAIDEEKGLTALHVAIGRNHLDLVRFLLSEGATVGPDRQGRWPSTIAELCEVSGEICDLVADAEAKVEDV